jgi:hypothetical protein
VPLSQRVMRLEASLQSYERHEAVPLVPGFRVANLFYLNFLAVKSRYHYSHGGLHDLITRPWLACWPRHCDQHAHHKVAGGSKRQTQFQLLRVKTMDVYGTSVVLSGTCSVERLQPQRRAHRVVVVSYGVASLPQTPLTTCCRCHRQGRASPRWP